MSSMLELKEKYYAQFKEELFNYCIPFWLKYGKDEQNGGVINCLDRQGQVFSTDKSVWMQGRCGWMFSYLSNTFGKNEEYLSFAKSCIEFENKYCFDKDGRMYFKVTKDGKPLRKRRYWFRKVYDMVFEIYLDPSKDPFKIFPKVYPEVRNFKSLAEPMILLNVSSILRQADQERTNLYNSNIDVCLKEIKNHYFEDKHAMLENITIDNKYLGETADGRIVNPGHDMECSYFLLKEALYRNDKELISFAETIFNDAIERGWDKKFKGVFYFKDVENKPVEAYEHDMKLWWPHNEGINASLLLFATTGKKEYAKWFETLTQYAFKHFSDRMYGEWFGYLRRDGSPTEPPCKGCTYKGPFHVMRCLATVVDIFDKIQ